MGIARSRSSRYSSTSSSVLPPRRSCGAIAPRDGSQPLSREHSLSVGRLLREGIGGNYGGRERFCWRSHSGSRSLGEPLLEAHLPQPCKVRGGDVTKARKTWPPAKDWRGMTSDHCGRRPLEVIYKCWGRGGKPIERINGAGVVGLFVRRALLAVAWVTWPGQESTHGNFRY